MHRVTDETTGSKRPSCRPCRWALLRPAVGPRITSTAKSTAQPPHCVRAHRIFSLHRVVPISKPPHRRPPGAFLWPISHSKSAQSEHPAIVPTAPRCMHRAQQMIDTAVASAVVCCAPFASPTLRTFSTHCSPILRVSIALDSFSHPRCCASPPLQAAKYTTPNTTKHVNQTARSNSATKHETLRS